MVKLRRLEALEQIYHNQNPTNECLLEFKANGCLTLSEAALLRGETLNFKAFYEQPTMTLEQIEKRKTIRAKYQEAPPLAFWELYE